MKKIITFIAIIMTILLVESCRKLGRAEITYSVYYPDTVIVITDTVDYIYVTDDEYYYAYEIKHLTDQMVKKVQNRSGFSSSEMAMNTAIRDYLMKYKYETVK